MLVGSGVQAFSLLKTDVAQCCVPSGVRLRAVSGVKRELESWWSWSKRTSGVSHGVLARAANADCGGGRAEARIQRA